MVVAFSWMDKGNEGWRRRLTLGQWENKEFDMYFIREWKHNGESELGLWHVNGMHASGVAPACADLKASDYRMRAIIIARVHQTCRLSSNTHHHSRFAIVNSAIHTFIDTTIEKCYYSPIHNLTSSCFARPLHQPLRAKPSQQ
jgi:hypothetical protein